MMLPKAPAGYGSASETKPPARWSWNRNARDCTLSAMPKQHVAFVTGAGRGIGEAIARRLAHEGVAVIVAARTASTCAAIASSIRATGGKAWPLTFDVSVREGVAPAVEKARKFALEFGPIDWLINNAGIAHSAPFLSHGRNREIDQYEEHMRVNFHGARWLIEVDSPMTDESVARIMEKTNKSKEEVRKFLASQNPGGTLVGVEEVAQAVWDLLEGEANGQIVELVGGKGVLPAEKTAVWR
jgi:hypothetical protein